jgi:hypothetical protein
MQPKPNSRSAKPPQMPSFWRRQGRLWEAARFASG